MLNFVFDLLFTSRSTCDNWTLQLHSTCSYQQDMTSVLVILPILIFFVFSKNKDQQTEREFCFVQGYANPVHLIDFSPLLCHIQVPFKILFQLSPTS